MLNSVVGDIALMFISVIFNHDYHLLVELQIDKHLLPLCIKSTTSTYKAIVAVSADSHCSSSHLKEMVSFNGSRGMEQLTFCYWYNGHFQVTVMGMIMYDHIKLGL